MKYICPVCSYNEVEEPPAHYEICSCCGTEFENDDSDVTHEELRARWIDTGAKWFSEYTLPPVGWSPVAQLARAGFVVGVPANRIHGELVAA